MAINNFLLYQQLRAPALLNNTSRVNNYEKLKSLIGNNETSKTEQNNQVNDKVSLAIDKIAKKMVTEMATITAESLKKHPSMADNYVLAMIDNGKEREVRVYKKDDLIKEFQGSEKEKENLKNKLDKDPILYYSSADGLNPSSVEEPYQELSKKLNLFLQKNSKLIDTLVREKANPFAKK